MKKKTHTRRTLSKEVLYHDGMDNAVQIYRIVSAFLKLKRLYEVTRDDGGEGNDLL